MKACALHQNFSTATEPAAANATVLVVENEALTRQRLRARLAAEGCHVLEAATGAAALEQLGDTIDVVLLDQQLPDADGLEWLRQAHETSRYTTSVCTGSLILGAAGLLQGLTATTYWAVLEDLRRFGAEPTSDLGSLAGKPVRLRFALSDADLYSMRFR